MFNAEWACELVSEYSESHWEMLFCASGRVAGDAALATDPRRALVLTGVSERRAWGRFRDAFMINLLFEERQYERFRHERKDTCDTCH